MLASSIVIVVVVVVVVIVVVIVVVVVVVVVKSQILPYGLTSSTADLLCRQEKLSCTAESAVSARKFEKKE